jgi:hypothetical protein
MSAKIIIGRNIKDGQKPGGMTGRPKPGRPNRMATWGSNTAGQFGLGPCQHPTAWESTQDPRFAGK